MPIQISLEFRNLAQEYRDVISDICHRMGVGMAEFLEKKVGSMKEWDLVNNIPVLPLCLHNGRNVIYIYIYPEYNSV